MKQEKKTKYYGEVWFPAYPNDKRFAFLTLANNKFEIETDLNPIKESKDLLEHYFDILGVFNGLGKVSFFYAILKSRSFGVVEAQKFSSNDKGEKKSYFIIGALLKEKKQTSGIGLLEKLGGIEFRIRDNTIRDWLSNSLKLDIPNKLSVFEKTKVINTEKFSIPFNNISLDDINITLFQGYSSHWRTYNYTIKKYRRSGI